MKSADRVQSMSEMRPAIFLDRDGVIIENRPKHVRSWADVEIYPQALKALTTLSDSPYRIVIVTNQAMVGRGLASKEAADDINRRLRESIERVGGRVDGIFMCPHRPADNCDCRKPKPGLLVQAAQEMSIQLDASILIGDSLSDIAAGKSAGVLKTALLRTGRGAEQERLPQAQELQPFDVFDSLADAVDHFLNKHA